MRCIWPGTCWTRRRAGFEVSYLSATEVERECGIRGRSGLRSYDQMVADPRQLAASFLRAAVQRGARVAAPVQIDAIDARQNGVLLRSDAGVAIRARHVVFATGYEMPRKVPQRGHRIVSTWAMATRRQPDKLWPGESLIWEASSPYLYVRTTADGRVLCGGEDVDMIDEAARDALLPAKTATLSRKLHALLPGIDARPEFCWCGSFGASPTGTPSIGAVPGMPNCFAVLGYGGNGITFSMLAAQMIRSAIVGGRDPDADLVSFRRRF
jgi:glycine/D-amino acid oxidase-like deaminating enzyme